MSQLCRLRNAKHGDNGQWAYNEIVSLRQQLAAANAEIERLNSDREDCLQLAKLNFNKGIEQLSAIQAVNQQLREALAAMVSYAREEGKGLYIADEALALPQDTTALEAMIAKTSEVMRERCAVFIETVWDEAGAAYEIRALPGVTLEDLK